MPSADSRQDFEPVKEQEVSALSPDTREVARYDDYLRQQLPQFFRRALEEAVNSEIRSIETRLRGQLFTLLDEARNHALHNYNHLPDNSPEDLPPAIIESSSIFVGDEGEAIPSLEEPPFILEACDLNPSAYTDMESHNSFSDLKPGSSNDKRDELLNSEIVSKSPSQLQVVPEGEDEPPVAMGHGPALPVETSKAPGHAGLIGHQDNSGMLPNSHNAVSFDDAEDLTSARMTGAGIYLPPTSQNISYGYKIAENQLLESFDYDGFECDFVVQNIDSELCVMGPSI